MCKVEPIARLCRMEKSVNLRESIYATLIAILGLSVVMVEKGLSQEFEAGLLEVNQASSSDWHSVFFNQTFSASPVVVLGPLSFNNAHGATLRVRNVTSTGFEFQIDEWD